MREDFWEFRPTHSIIRQGDWKLIRRWETGRLELFNLADDLGETTDLAESMPDRAERLDAQLSDWLERTGSKVPRLNPDYKGKP